MSLQYLAMVAFLDWEGICPPWWPRGPRPWPPPPLVPDPFPDTYYSRTVNNIYYAGLAGVIMTVVATHPEEAFSLRTGPLMLVPAFRVLTNLYYNNTSVLATKKAKM